MDLLQVKKLKVKDPAFLYEDYVVEIDPLLDIKQGWKISCSFGFDNNII